MFCRGRALLSIKLRERPNYMICYFI